MDKKSEAYRKAVELDRHGFAQQLQNNSAEYFKTAEEDEKTEMGSTIGIVVDKARKVLDWALETERSGEEEEFEYGDHADDVGIIGEPLVESPDKEDPELALDPLIAKERDQVHVALEQLKTVFSPKKAPTFTLPISLSERIRFRELINWINQTSGEELRYIRGDSALLTVTKLPEVDISSGTVSVSVYTEGVTESYCSLSESIVSHNNATTRSTAVEISSRNITANGQSLVAQLANGVILPPRSSKGKKKKVTLPGFGIPENEILGILTDHPNIKMDGLVKKLYQRQGNWKLMHNLYDIKYLKIVSPD